uniref:Uncharacterized protein n=1 Tax=Anguilla anguilla TaxID=7936 RepID=A0A0E9X7P3_ANGAN
MKKGILSSDLFVFTYINFVFLWYISSHFDVLHMDHMEGYFSTYALSLLYMCYWVCSY